MEKFLSYEEISLDKNIKLFPRKKLGSGSFGNIYLGLNIQTNKKIAIKCESVCETNNLLLKKEANILKYLQNSFGIPEFYSYIEKEKYNFMLFELLGPSLQDLFDLFQKAFSLKTILQLGDQMLSRIEFLHSKYLIHRDIKPSNFLIGLSQKSNIIYISDFGLSKPYMEIKNGKHIPYKDGNSLIGTARYSSIYSQIGIELSRRDDLESLFYTLIYLSKGSLPWQGIKCKSKAQKYNLILEKKMSTNNNDLCKDLPCEFISFICYIKDLKFEEKPNYLFLKELLGKMFYRNKFNYDLIFDFSYLFEKNNNNKLPIKENSENEEKKIKKINNNKENNISHQ